MQLDRNELDRYITRDDTRNDKPSIEPDPDILIAGLSNEAERLREQRDVLLTALVNITHHFEMKDPTDSMVRETRRLINEWRI